MELYFLGTVAGTPSRERNVSSVALRMPVERGSFWLFDCGEGTQHQILRSPLKLQRLEFVFITHLHGDHLYGLPGLLTSRSNQGAEQPLTVFGPRGIRNFLETSLSVSGAHLDYKLEIRELAEGVVFEDDKFRVETGKLEHRIECFGYRIEEKERPGRLDAEKLREMGVKPGPLYAELKRGRDVRTESGRVLRSREFVGPSVPGRVVTILGDTRICDNGKRLSRDADVLVHEATFADDLRELAMKYYHSTARQAAELAEACGVDLLVLTHLSSRYQGEEGARLLEEEARRFHQRTEVARDFASFPVPRRSPR